MKQNKIAITGGIGSGKSTVSDIIRSFGYPVYSADEEYALALQDKDVLEIIGQTFPVVHDGVLDKKALSSIVFSDKKELERLNTITHPIIMQRIDEKMKEEISFAEIPLLFEGNYQSAFDHVIVVMRSLPLRIQSVMKRNNLSEQEVLERIKNQYDYEHNDFSNYYVIHNNSDLITLKGEVISVLEKIIHPA